ncbi:putative DNA-binding transcriptional regulator YafY [Salinibacter ruber]|jgi:predicted DNA-binding transcriptional regulator YafY|uniref:helix-turn-helix transcriptional regulator n=1 Tax=Salinibacter ruber TaxID=146919 RepID=UPI00216702F8|nr:WYL domain-containing protein [Salinibacter ruber]MCS3940332.1 putative DNA-binding transcriptional regulator YafY [Salinibacter ruber]
MANDTKETLRRLLSQGREMTLDEMRRHLDVSRRQVRRLLDALDEEGGGVRERWDDGTKRFSLDPEARSLQSRPIELKERELQALTVAASAAQAILHPTPFDNGLREAVQKLLATAGPTYSFEPEFQEKVWHFETGAASNIEPEVFWTVVQAASRQETLAIDYYSASSGEHSSGRKVDPLVIAEQSGSWLVAAYCHEKQRVLDFSLPAIEAADTTGTGFSRPAEFDRIDHFESRFSALKGEEMKEVVLHVNAGKAEYFERKTYHPSQLEKELESGDLEVHFKVSNLDDIAAFVRSWGPHVRVRRPESLAERIKSELAETLQAYQGME